MPFFSSFSFSWFHFSHKIDDVCMFGEAEPLTGHLSYQLLANGGSRLDDPLVPPWQKQLGKEATCQNASTFAEQAVFWMVLNKKDLPDFDRIL
jgi:hypothetical protein